MVELVRVLFVNAFKTNDSLKFAVLTGCLRIPMPSPARATVISAWKWRTRISASS